MTNYHPDVQRAYESHCADGYVVPDDETGPQEATDGAVRDFPCCEAPGDGEAAERRTEGLSVVERAAMILGRDGNPPQLGAAMALADAGLLAADDPTADRDRALASLSRAEQERDDARGALDETLDDLTRTLARAEKAEAGRDAWRRTAIGRADGLVKAGARLYHAEAERDRARDTAAAALEAEVARLTAKVERVEVLASTLDKEARSMTPCTGPNCGGCVRGADAAFIRAALSDTTGEAP